MEKRKTKNKKVRNLNVVQVLIVLVVAIVLLFWVKSDRISQLNGGDSISDYITLIGISFSVTFITTSLLGGLSDKSEKIYWINYPEEYLINNRLNYNVLSMISFICLGIQFVVMIFNINDSIRKVVFLSAFFVGILSIVILTYRFTAVFFSKKKILEKAQVKFKSMVDNLERVKKLEERNNKLKEIDKELEEIDKELEDAVIGIFNNTLEAIYINSHDLERVKENVELLLKHKENKHCSFWLKQLIIQISQINPLILHQLISFIDDENFMILVDMIGSSVEGSPQLDEALCFVHFKQLSKLNKDINKKRQTLEEDPNNIDEVIISNILKDTERREANDILARIKTNNANNCIFLLKQLSKLPYDLLKCDECYNTVVTKWDIILERYAEVIKEKNVYIHRQFKKNIFKFLLNHPGEYYDDEYIGRLVIFGEEMGKELNKKTADFIKNLSEEDLVFMIDALGEEERQTFMVWLADQISQGNIDKEMWKLSKKKYDKSFQYYELWIKYIIKELEKKSKFEYEDISNDESYSFNIPLWEYVDYVREMTKLLSSVKEYEGKYHSSLEKFIKAVISRVCIGEKNKFSYEYADFDKDAYERKEKVDNKTINCYCIVFDALVENEMIGIDDFCKALELELELEFTDGTYINNYFNNDEEKNQKQSEMLFFLERLNKFVSSDESSNKLPDEVYARIMLNILANPCIDKSNIDKSENNTVIYECSEYITSKGGKVVEDFLNEFFGEDVETPYGPRVNKLKELYYNANNYERFGNDDLAKYFNDAEDDYENSLNELKDLLNDKFKERNLNINLVVF